MMTGEARAAAEAAARRRHLRAALARSPGDPALARELAACLAAAGLAAAPSD